MEGKGHALLLVFGRKWCHELGKVWGKKSFLGDYGYEGCSGVRWHWTRGFISTVEVDYRGQSYRNLGTQIGQMFLLCPLETVTITLPSVEGVAASINYRITRTKSGHWSMPCEGAFASRLATSRGGLAESIPKWIECDLTWAVQRQVIPFHQS